MRSSKAVGGAPPKDGGAEGPVSGFPTRARVRCAGEVPPTEQAIDAGVAGVARAAVGAQTTERGALPQLAFPSATDGESPIAPTVSAPSVAARENLVPENRHDAKAPRKTPRQIIGLDLIQN